MSIEWKRAEIGDQLTATLVPGLTLTVTHEAIRRVPVGDPAYNVIVFGQRLKTRALTEEEGKARAIAVARGMLNAALEALHGL